MVASVRSRFVAATVAVAALSVGLTAWIATSIASSDAREDVTRSLDTDANIYTRLLEYGSVHRSWRDVDSLVAKLSERTGRRIALRTRAGREIVDSDAIAGADTRALPETPAAVIDPFRPKPFFSGGEGVGPQPQIVLTPEEAAAREALARSAADCLTARGVAFERTDEGGLPYFTVDFDDAFAATAHDECVNPALYAPTAADLRASRDDAEVIAACLTERGVAFDRRTDDLGLDFVEPTGSDARTNRAFERCSERATRRRFDPVTADPAVLYLGSRGDAPFGVSGVGLERTAGLAIAVLLLAVLIAVFAARRITRPLHDLTGAVAQLGTGDYSGRVDDSAPGEVGRLAATFNRMAGTLQRNEAARRRMVSDVAHELRNPVSTITGTLEAIQDGVYTPTPDVVASLVEETEHLAIVLNDLQDLALVDAGRLPLELRPVDLRSIVRHVVDAAAPGALVGAIRVELSDGDPVVVDVDSRRIHQVVANLVANAVRHSDRDRAVRVDVDQRDGWGEARVTDTGDGIPVDDLPHVFERFYRADASRDRATGGTGLGLAISREIARVHGGDITVRSTIGEGSVFTLRLPLRGARAPSHR